MMEAAIIIGGVVNGPILGVFSAGMLLPWVNSAGVLVGFTVSLISTAWVATGGSVYKHHHPYISRTSPPNPTNISGCPPAWLENYQPSLPSQTTALPGHIPLYDISYVWYTTLGASLVIILALLTSLFTSTDIRMLDKKLLSPVLPRLWSWLPSSLRDYIDDWWLYVGADLPSNNMEMKKREADLVK